MDSGKLELSDLGRLVLAERSRRGISLRDAALDVGIPFNTLARVEKGHVPDLPKFKRLVEWCGADIKQFFEIQEKATTTTDVIAAHLRADRDLPQKPQSESQASSATSIRLWRALSKSLQCICELPSPSTQTRLALWGLAERSESSPHGGGR